MFNSWLGGFITWAIKLEASFLCFNAGQSQTPDAANAQIWGIKWVHKLMKLLNEAQNFNIKTFAIRLIKKIISFIKELFNFYYYGFVN